MMRKKGKGMLYRLVVPSELSERYAAAFEGLMLETKDGQTILFAEIIDQPHLFGILDRINGLGLKLLTACRPYQRGCPLECRRRTARAKGRIPDTQADPRTVGKD